MKLIQKNETVQYRGQDIDCEKLVYACVFCDFELHEEWMAEKLNDQLAGIYEAKFPTSQP